MLRLQALDLRLRIAARLLQIFGCVVELVLIQIHLRLGNVDLVLQIVLLRVGRGRQFTRQQRNAFLIFLERQFGFLLAIGNLPWLAAKGVEDFLRPCARRPETKDRPRGLRLFPPDAPVVVLPAYPRAPPSAGRSAVDAGPPGDAAPPAARVQTICWPGLSPFPRWQPATHASTPFPRWRRPPAEAAQSR